MTHRILQGDVLDRLRQLPAESVHCVVTSPPYWGLRDYGVAGQIGLEPTPAEFLTRMVEVFREVRRVLRSDGTCWVNMGDSYAGSWGAQSREHAGKHSANISMLSANQAKHAQIRDSGTGALSRTPGMKPKDLVGMPWRLAFALQDDGWYLRQDIIWSKPNPMPESVTDRCTKAHEYLFLLTKSSRYYYDAEAIKEPSGGWNGSDFHDGKNLLNHPSVGKNREPRASGNKTHKNVTEYEGSASEEHRTAAGLLKISGQAYAQRNKRSVWEIATEAFPEAHFATFPTKLVEPCILAGTSEKGCCAQCGSPWVRVVHRSGGTTGKGWHDHSDELVRGARGGTVVAKGFKDYRTETKGWNPSCDRIEPEMVPSLVMDIFSGAGTTGLVALRLGRAYLGIELNPEYVAMSERRLTDDRPLFTPPQIEAVPADTATMQLFGEVQA